MAYSLEAEAMRLQPSLQWLIMNWIVMAKILGGGRFGGATAAGRFAGAKNHDKPKISTPSAYEVEASPVMEDLEVADSVELQVIRNLSFDTTWPYASLNQQPGMELLGA